MENLSYFIHLFLFKTPFYFVFFVCLFVLYNFFSNLDFVKLCFSFCVISIHFHMSLSQTSLRRNTKCTFDKSPVYRRAIYNITILIRYQCMSEVSVIIFLI